jgi:hypothetical protein
MWLTRRSGGPDTFTQGVDPQDFPTHATVLDMDRRALLAAGSAALAGCLPLRGSPRTPGRNVNEPQIRATYEWLPDESAYRVRHAAGNRFTAENTGSLRVIVDADEVDDPRRTWVGGEDSAQPFPLAVGDELRVRSPRRGDVRVVWTDPEGVNSASLDVYRIEEQPTATPTPGRTATEDR